MDIKLLKKAIDNSLDNENPRHSDAWKEKLLSNLLEIKTKFPEQFIRQVQKGMIKNLIESGRKFLLFKYPGLKDKSDDILQDGLERWLKYYKPEKGYEFSFFSRCILSAAFKDYNDEHPIIETIKQFDDVTGLTFDLRTVNIRASIIPTDFSEAINDFNTASNEDEIIILGTPVNIPEEVDKPLDSERDVPNNQFSRANRIARSSNYDQERRKVHSADSEKHHKTAFFILRHLILKNEGSDNGQNNKPELKPRYLPKSSFLEKTNKEKFSNYSAVTSYHKGRNSILKHSSERDFMELCVSLIAEGKSRFEKEIADGYFKESDKKDVPILSAVAVDANNQLIDYCYKGQIESFNTHNNERRSFQKHCEFTLIDEIIASSNRLHELKGGTIFVTLEPCNMRTFFCLNPRCDSDCKHDEVIIKVPCAVRCLESGIAKVFIGTIDTNPKVEKKGAEILATGCYTFQLKDGRFYSDRGPEREHKKDITAQMLLEQYFINKGYILEEHSSETKKYRINNGVVVEYFPLDLVEEICELNGVFLQAQQQEYFY